MSEKKCSVLVREVCTIAFSLDFPDHRLFSPQFRGKTETITYDGEKFHYKGTELTGFDADFAKIYIKHSGVEDYFKN